MAETKLLLAARAKGVERPAHAVEFLEDDDGTLVADTKTLCGRLRTEETDLDLRKPQPFGAVDDPARCATCDTFAVPGANTQIPTFPSPTL